MSDKKEWGDHIMVFLLSMFLRSNIQVLSPRLTWQYNDNARVDLIIVYNGVDHFDATGKLFINDSLRFYWGKFHLGRT